MSAVQRGLVLIIGGVRAGKSRLAERLAARHGERVLYVATAEAGDAEMGARIATHRAARPEGWRTVEAPLEVAAALATAPACDAALLDCLTLWVSNLLLASVDAEAPDPDAVVAAEGRISEAVDGLLAWQRDAGTPLYVVTNEVGMGVTPPYPLGRAYQDALGRANQRVAAAASEVFLVAAGLALPLRSLGASPIDAPLGPPLS